MNYKQYNPEFEARVRARFEQSRVMKMLSTRLTRIALGEADIELPYKADFCQSHGFIHGGIIGTLLDTACGYASFTLVPADSDVLTIEYKTNFLAPAIGEILFGRGRALRQGKSIIVCEAEGVVTSNGVEKLVAKMTATIMVVPVQPD
jgi:uncharacterized protein (TIGR00369 family)